MIDPAPVPTVSVFGTPEYAAIQQLTTPPAAWVRVGADSAPLSRFAKIRTAHVVDVLLHLFRQIGRAHV